MKSKLVLTQKPNLPILVAVGSSALSFLIFVWPTVGEVFLLIAFGSYFTWAWLELFQGINYIRRIMGAVVLVLLLSAGVIALMYALKTL